MTIAYLTIDDCPSSDLPQKLDVLEKYDIPALLFCVGHQLTDHSDLARQAVERGFHLGNHTYSHPHCSDLSATGFRDEIERTENLIDAVYERASVARPASVFRFPYGDRSDSSRDRFQQILSEYDFTPPNPDAVTYDWYQEHHAGDHDWFWTFSAQDWQVETESGLRKRFVSSGNRLNHSSPDIVLFHDAGNTVALFEYFIELLVDHGVEFVDPLSLLT